MPVHRSVVGAIGTPVVEGDRDAATQELELEVLRAEGRSSSDRMPGIASVRRRLDRVVEQPAGQRGLEIDRTDAG
jgi:hypothetical protein